MTIPDIREPVSPDYTTKTAWTCKHFDAARIQIAIKYVSARQTDSGRFRDRVTALSVASKPITQSLLAEINDWLEDKSIRLVSVVCHLPERTEMRVSAIPNDSVESIDLVLIADAKGRFRRVE
jgi:hypothetical protein